MPPSDTGADWGISNTAFLIAYWVVGVVLQVSEW
jgi:hypothetical protein